MITVETILLEIQDLSPDDLSRWIGEDLVRPEGPPGNYRFHEIDVARIRLILELRGTLEVNETALPAMLHLLDQLYGLRRQMRRLNAAMAEIVPEELRIALSNHLAAAIE
jgi:chaperone modulatory protein CbpM